MNAGGLAVNPGTQHSRAWQHSLIALGAVWLWILFCLRDTALGMVGIWARSDTFMHCFLIAPIAAWLVWQKRAQIAAMRPAPRVWRVLPVVVAAGFAWIMGELAVVNVVPQYALVALLVASVPALLGLEVAWALAFPLAYLFLAVPAGEVFTPYMMDHTADFTIAALRLSGIPVYREGLQFVIPSGNWSVVEACSGVRYLIASFTVGVLYAYLTFSSLRARLIFTGFSIAVPVVANWLRAYMIVMLGHYSGNKLAVGADHLVYGWVFFGIVIMIMFAVGARFADPQPAAAPAQAAGAGGPPDRESAASAWRGPWWAACVLALASALPVLWIDWIGRQDMAGGAVRLAAAQSLGPWRLEAQPVSGWRPAFAGPAAEIQAGYTRDALAVGLHVLYYRDQAHAGKLVSSTNELVKSKDPVWSQTAAGSREIVAAGQSFAVRTATLRGAQGSPQSDGRWLVWHWYWIDGRFVTNDYHAKALAAWSRLRGRGDDGALVVMVTRAQPPDGGESALRDFAGAAMPALHEQLRQARDSR